MTVKSMVRSNIKKMQMISKLMDKLKRIKLIQDFHMHLPFRLEFKLQPKLQKMLPDSHMLMQLVLTIQVPQLWIQMLSFGKELLYTMAKFMVKNNIKEMLMIFKHMEKHKKMLQTQDFLMLLLLKYQHQQVLSKTLMGFHTLMLKEITIPGLQLWTQMHQYGKEKKFMMVRFMEKNNICKMPLISKLTEKSKKLLLTLDFHINQLLKIVNNHQHK